MTWIRKEFSAEQIAAMKRMRRAGIALEAIGSALGICNQTVARRLREWGVRGRVHTSPREWTAAEDDELRQMRAAFMPLPMISRSLDRGVGSILHRVKQLRLPVYPRNHADREPPPIIERYEPARLYHGQRYEDDPRAASEPRHGRLSRELAVSVVGCSAAWCCQ